MEAFRDTVEVASPRPVDFRMSVLHSQHCRKVAVALAAVEQSI
jgi:hypothetical protein